MQSARFLTRLTRSTVLVSPCMAAVLLAGVLSAVPSSALAKPSRPGVKQGAPAEGRPGKVKPRKKDESASKTLDAPAKASWPNPGKRQVTVEASKKTGESTDVGGLPVRVSGVEKATTGEEKVQVEVLDGKFSSVAGVSGVLLRVSPGSEDPSDKVKFTLDYSSFGQAFGGGYGSYLRLAKVPDCAVQSPRPESCDPRPQELESENDTDEQTVSAEVEMAPTGMLLALAAGDTSVQGNYGATGLAPSSKWNVAPATGGFSWSYPLRVPPVPGGDTPQIGLSYSSQSIDGRTATTNNQGSWIGEGFSYEPGYVERRYKPCADDGHTGVGDMCWSHANATIMLGGSSTELVKDDTDGKWRLKNDNGSKVEALTGTTNGDNNGEYWRITTIDGTEYYFGLNRLPGWASGNEVTNSAWTLPVFGDDSGEPCYNATFADASCNQAWRWNLDYVKDPHGNVISYFYGTETGHYAKNAKLNVNGTAYDRAGYLKRIDYGEKDGQVYDGPSPARVNFAVEERCLATASFTCALCVKLKWDTRVQSY